MIKPELIGVAVKDFGYCYRKNNNNNNNVSVFFQEKFNKTYFILHLYYVPVNIKLVRISATADKDGKCRWHILTFWPTSKVLTLNLLFPVQLYPIIQNFTQSFFQFIPNILSLFHSILYIITSVMYRNVNHLWSQDKKLFSNS